MPTYTQANRSVRIATPFAENVLLLKSLHGTEALGKPFQFDLILSSETPHLQYEKIIGKKVCISLETGARNKDGSGIVRYFNGHISRFSQRTYDGALVEYQATVVPWLWFLTRSSNCRIFQDQSIPEIIKQVFQDFGYSDIVDNLHGSYRKRSYCVQYRETAFQFVSRLMEEEGIYYYFQHAKTKHSIVLCDSTASHAEYPGYSTLKYAPNSANAEDVLTSWVVQHEVQSDAYTVTNFNFTSPSTDYSRSSQQPVGYGQTPLKQFEYLGEQSPYDQYSQNSPNENERLAHTRAEELQAGFETYASGGNARGISAGAWFTLTNPPCPPFDAPAYLTTSAEYQIASGQFTTAAEYLAANSTFSATLTAIPKSVQFRSPRVTPKPIVYGPQTATVVASDGETISTDKYGQVKVRFHWDQRDASFSSCWMRVSQAWAGKNWGDMAVPHKDDEVIVECLEGDPDRPIITGRVYNENNLPPMDLPDNKDLRIIQDDFGNHLTLNATSGEESISMQSPRDKWDVTIGNAHDFKLGTSTGGTFGASLEAKVGVKGEINVGLQYAFALAATHELGFGSKWGYFRGTKKEISEADINSLAEKNNIISAGDNLCLVGGANATSPSLVSPTDRNSIVTLEEDAITISVGDKQALAAPPFGRKAGAFYAGTVGSAVVAAICTGFAAAQAGKKDANPWVPGGIALGSSALSIVFAILLSRQLSTMAEVSTVDHGAAALGKIKLNSKDGDISIESKDKIGVSAKKALLMESETEDVLLQQKDSNTTITLKKNGDIVLSSKGKIEVASGGDLTLEATGKINLKASNILGGGTVKLSNGALEIMGPPVPPRPPPPPPRRIIAPVVPARRPPPLPPRP